MDRSAFESHLKPVLDVAYGYAYKLTHNQDDAMDLVQEAAVQAFRSLGTFQEGTNFKAWFMKVLTNKFYKSKARETRRGRTVSLDDAEDLYLFRESEKAGVMDTLDTVFDKLEEEEVQRAIDDLPEEFRVVCLLYFMNDFSYEEIAEAAGIPLGTVRSRLHRGRKLLQRALWDVAESRGLVGAAAKGGRA
jgi:RNA polymerase sigma-70 factor (ECF subfamily)